MGKFKRAKANHRADTRGGQWAGIPHAVLDSLAYLSCDLWERAILVELVRAMNGYNNGKIALSQRQISARLRSSNFRRIGTSVAGLMEKGLIDVEVEGNWKERKAREYRLTFVNTGTNGAFHSATNEYRDWRPEAKSCDDPVSASATKSAVAASAAWRKPAAPASAGIDEKPPKMPVRSAEPVSSLIREPYPSGQQTGEGRDTSSWWVRERVVQAYVAILYGYAFSLASFHPCEARAA